MMRFGQRADMLAKQFDAYQPIPGIHINGEASLGENIVDNHISSTGGRFANWRARRDEADELAAEEFALMTPFERIDGDEARHHAENIHRRFQELHASVLFELERVGEDAHAAMGCQKNRFGYGNG